MLEVLSNLVFGRDEDLESDDPFEFSGETKVISITLIRSVGYILQTTKPTGRGTIIAKLR